MTMARTAIMQKSRMWQLCLSVAVTTSIALYFFLTSTHSPVRSFQPQPKKHEIDYASLVDNAPKSEFYEWRTVTAFPALEPGRAANATLEELCALFPKYKLWDIQPVLKTGHGVMDRVRQSLRSTSACLVNLLILSDLDEEVEDFDGLHAVSDIIADIPKPLLMSDNQTIPYRELKQLAANGSLDDENLSRVKGWQTDKFKFLPAISRAWRMAPEKRWYVFYEGDTYIVWDTVFRLLQNFDADKPHYFGSPSPGREGIWFANGGPGYILSREAMRRMTKNDFDSETAEWIGNWELKQRWGEVLGDCCGDSVLGWALHEHGVELGGLWPMFNPHPLHGIPFADLYWCQPVLSLHKSLFEDEIDLWRWEWEARNTIIDSQRPLLYRDLAQAFFNITSFTTRREDYSNAGWDGYGPAHDDPHHPHDSVDSCATACENANGCFQWTYHLRRCTFVRSFRVGGKKEPNIEKDRMDQTWSKEEQRYIAGWDTAKIRKWIDDRPCDQVQWVRPSIKRVF